MTTRQAFAGWFCKRAEAVAATGCCDELHGHRRCPDSEAAVGARCSTIKQEELCWIGGPTSLLHDRKLQTGVRRHTNNLAGSLNVHTWLWVARIWRSGLLLLDRMSAEYITSARDHTRQHVL